MTAPYTREEFLICVLAREFAGCRHIAVGSAGSLHGAAALLAAELSPGTRVTILGSAAENFFSDGGRELFDAAMQGRIDGFILGGGQIDGEANLNFLGTGHYPSLSVRWPGNFGSPVMYSAVNRVVLFREEHSKRVLVPKVDFISAPGRSPAGAFRKGGPSALVTGKCVFSFDRTLHRFVLKSVHPGSTVQDVLSNTGFEFSKTEPVPVTPAPNDRELSIIRDAVARQIAKTYPAFASRAFLPAGEVHESPHA